MYASSADSFRSSLAGAGAGGEDGRGGERGGDGDRRGGDFVFDSYKVGGGAYRPIDRINMLSQ